MSMHFHLLITPSLTRLLWPRSGCPAPSPRGHVCCQSTPPATASGRGLHWNSAVEFRAGATEAAQAALEEAWKGGNDAGMFSCFFLRFFGVFFPIVWLKKPIETSAVMSSTPKTRYRSWPGAHPGLRQCRAVAAQHRLDRGGGGKGPALSDVAWWVNWAN